MLAARSWVLALAGSALLGLVGCGNTGEGDGFEPPPEEPLPYVPSTIPYPAAPYGVDIGDIIQDYEFPGFPDPIDRPTSELVPIKLSDFYNPTGQDTFPEGGPHPAGTPKPRGLLIVVSAVWCGPCQLEADEVLPEKHAQYEPLGGEFLLVLADGPSPGEAAETKHLSGWTKEYDTDFPAVIDPDYDLGKIFPSSAYPANMIIDTRTMTIVERITGAAPESGSFWSTFEQVIAAD
jgi:hypothetical protein